MTIKILANLATSCRIDRILLLVILLFNANQITGQNNNVIKIKVADKETGNPVSDANVLIQNTWNGAATSSDGLCKITVEKLPVNLVISHIAYKTQVLSLSGAYGSDTVCCYLETKPIDLDEVQITAKSVAVFNQPRYLILDFELFDDGLLILERYKYMQNNHTRLILTDAALETKLSWNIPLCISPVSIFKDCLGNCHIFTKDTVYQVIFSNNLLSLDYPVEISKFNEAVKDCLFYLGDMIYFQRVYDNGYSVDFYTVNIKNKTKRMFLQCSDRERMNGLKRSLRYLSANPPDGVPLGIAMYFEKTVMFKPVKLELIRLSDTLFLFNHHNGSIEVFSESGFPVRTVKVDYQKHSTWKNTIHIDHKLHKAFTVIGEQLFEVNLTNGQANFLVSVGLFDKLRVYNGQLYLLKKNHSATSAEKYIERTRLQSFMAPI